jgi:hypothetical protein
MVNVKPSGWEKSFFSTIHAGQRCVSQMLGSLLARKDPFVDCMAWLILLIMLTLQRPGAGYFIRASSAGDK